jgi:PadR family transcriptional regulator, regulatory protein PadR
MYICPMYSSELLKGTLKTIILHLLQENGKMYGYEMTQLVKKLSQDKIQITEGALYPMLHALEAVGDVKTETIFIGKRIRKYYVLTKQGKTTSKNKLEEFKSFLNTMNSILQPQKSAHGFA